MSYFIPSLLDSGNGILPYKLNPQLNCNYWRADWREVTVIQGTWAGLATALQTDYDPKLVNSNVTLFGQGGDVGYIDNFASNTNLDEIHFGNLILNAGTYKLSFAYVKEDSAPIIEILHGSTSLGTWDAYAAAATHNQIGTATYSPTTRVTGNLRLRANGKNASSDGYALAISRIELIRTG